MPGSVPGSAPRADATTRVRLGKSVVSGKDSSGETFTTYGKTAPSGQDQHDQVSDGGGSSDKWDFGDDSSEEEEHEHDVKPVGKKAQASGVKAPVGGEACAAPGGTTSVGGGSGGIPEEPQVCVAVDKLGRRQNAPRRCVLRPGRE